MAIAVLERDDFPFPHLLPEFQYLFSDEAACAGYLERARGGDGFVCPHAGRPASPIVTPPALASLVAGSAGAKLVSPPAPSWSICTHRARSGSGRPTGLPAEHSASRPFRSRGNSGFRATRPLPRFSTSFALAGCPTRTGSGESPEKSPRLMKSGWAAIRAARGAAFPIGCSWLALSKSASVSAAASTSGGPGDTPAAFGLHRFRTEAPNRSVASLGAPWCQASPSSPTIGMARLALAKHKIFTPLSQNRAIRKSRKPSCPSFPSCSPISRPSTRPPPRGQPPYRRTSTFRFNRHFYPLITMPSAPCSASPTTLPHSPTPNSTPQNHDQLHISDCLRQPDMHGLCPG